MKSIFVLLVLLFNVLTSFANDSEQVYIYGVDYSSAKIYAASETADDFATAFEGINRLLVSEPQKYDFSRIVGPGSKLKIEMILDLTHHTDFSNLIVLDKDIEPIDISDKVKSYILKEEDGLGFIIIASLLDKSMDVARYDVVLFDIASRKILKEKEFIGKTRGFGLRNYWAHTIYQLSKKFNFDSANRK